MAAVEKVRIVVVGDSGVGKTSLVHLICHEESISSPAWTIGCTVEVKLYDYKEGMPGGKTFFLEFWDVGGSANHEMSRSIFYHSVNGLILVHDLTNKKSFTNLRKWLSEVLNSSGSSSGSNPKVNDGWFGGGDTVEDFDPEQFAGNQIPTLVVGTKLDVAGSSRLSNSTRGMNLVDEIGADVININCNDLTQLRPGHVNSRKLRNFFDKVIERRFHTRDTSQSYGYQEGPKLFQERTSKRKQF
jgi:Rab-like protein 3